MHLIPAGDAHRDLPADEEAAHEKHPPPPRRQPPPRHQPPETSLFSEQRLDREERDVHVHLFDRQTSSYVDPGPEIFKCASPTQAVGCALAHHCDRPTILRVASVCGDVEVSECKIREVARRERELIWKQD